MNQKPTYEELEQRIRELEKTESERHRKEKALHEQVLHYNILMDVSLDGIAIIDQKHKIREANKRFANMLGYSQEEVFGLHTWDWEAIMSEAEIRANFADLTKTKTTFETRHRRKDGTIYDAEVTACGAKLGDESMVLTITRDITERKQAEEALCESEAFVNDVIRSMNDGLFVLNDRFQYAIWNPAMEAISGVPKERVINQQKKPWELFPHLIEVGIDQVMRRAMAGETVVNHEVPYTLSSGKSGFTSESYFPLLDRNGAVTGVIGVIRDITEEKAFEQALRESKRMETVGYLAGGIAHEFNNALAVIVGNIELLKMSTEQSERQFRQFQAMEHSARRMSLLTDRLLAYARKGKYHSKRIMLDEFVRETLPILQYDLSPELSVETFFQVDIKSVKADDTQLQMVLSAILANSSEAIEGKGCVKISVENRDIDEAFEEKHPDLKPGPYVCLTIEDNGRGMNEEEKARIFDPFFTTKFQGRGMSMPAVHGIVKNHGGWVSVDSELGKGTEVRIYLPVVEDEPKDKEGPLVEPERGKGIILVVEDEDMVLEVTQAMLERSGYQVVVAKTGESAVQIAETFEGQIDLALLDMKLPDMDGAKLYPLLMKARPDLKVIVSSGFAVEGAAQAILDAGAEDFIQKPFSAASLSEKVKKVLLTK